jgi:hypothetical protein
MWLYLLYRAGVYKIGISKQPKKRIKSIKNAKLVIMVPVLLAREYERFLHSRYAHLRVKSGKESGSTEWFRFWFSFRPALWLMFFFVMEWGIGILLIGFLIWI